MSEYSQGEFVPTGDFGFVRMLALHNPQLLTQDEYFKVLVPIPASEIDKVGEQQREKLGEDKGDHASQHCS